MALENALVLYDSRHYEKISMAIQYSNYMVRVSGAVCGPGVGRESKLG
jgi:hypothetical protein